MNLQEFRQRKANNEPIGNQPTLEDTITELRDLFECYRRSSERLKRIEIWGKLDMTRQCDHIFYNWMKNTSDDIYVVENNKIVNKTLAGNHVVIFVPKGATEEEIVSSTGLRFGT